MPQDGYEDEKHWELMPLAVWLFLTKITIWKYGYSETKFHMEQAFLREVMAIVFPYATVFHQAVCHKQTPELPTGHPPLFS